MTDYHRIVIQRLAKKHLDRHRDVLDRHKAKGPAFRQAVENLERMLDDTPEELEVDFCQSHVKLTALT